MVYRFQSNDRGLEVGRIRLVRVLPPVGTIPFGVTFLDIDDLADRGNSWGIVDLMNGFAIGEVVVDQRLIQEGVGAVDGILKRRGLEDGLPEVFEGPVNRRVRLSSRKLFNPVAEATDNLGLVPNMAMKT